MAVSRRLRYEVLRRDQHRCRYCGASAPDIPMTVDHVVPTALGGGDEPGNLVAACRDCNSGKSASAPDAAIVADVDQRAVAWSQAMNVVIEQRAAELRAARTRIRRFDKKWRSWTDATGGPFPREGNWQSSIQRFMAHGLDDEFLADAVDTAIGDRRIAGERAWTYFCGICWRELDRIRERTAELVARGPALAPDEEPVEPWPADFDTLELADTYLCGLIVFLEDREEVARDLAKIVSAGLWASMEAAWVQYREGASDAGMASTRPEVVEALMDAAQPTLRSLREHLGGSGLDGAQ